MRKKLIVGNWKMHLNASQASLLVHRLHERIKIHRDIEVVLAPSIRNGITPILCVGETKQERQQGETRQVLHDQLMTGLSNLTAGEVGSMVVAYEPVWAISNGSNFADHEIPKPDEVSSVVEYIRAYVKGVFGPKAAKNLRVLYGGSTMPDMVAGIVSVPGVDGFLVGGASLNYHSFSNIIELTRKWQREQGGE
jgi:triosephosphate isomerase